MSEVLIKVENISKVFKLYSRTKDRLKEAFSLSRKKYYHEYQALENISFEVKRGESVSILGGNGAGKSTLLKILTGVQTPSTGKVMVKGRVAALLELGSGFNPELTGLENIYFQGAITGFTKEEMNLKLQEIIDFADIGEFIHQPVKTYSSGMFMRLAFSISINVDPDILIVDEALGVGDVSFQQKCFKRMKKFVDHGKVLIFVSHDIATMRGFCSRGIVLSHGKLIMDDHFSTASELYFNKYVLGLDVKNEKNELLSHSYYYEHFSKFLVQIKNNVLKQEDWLEVEFEISPNKDIDQLGIGVTLSNYKLEEVLGINNYMYDKNFGSLQKDVTAFISMRFKLPLIADGEYAVGFSVCDGTMSINKQLIRNNSVGKIKILQKYPQYGRGFYLYNQTADVDINFRRSEQS